MRKIKITLLFILVFLVLSGGLSKALMQAISLKELVADSQSIIIGTVEKSECKEEEIESEKKIFTYVTLKVEQYIKNDLGESKITIRQLGGTIGNRSSLVEDQVGFEDRERCLVFLSEELEKNIYDVYGWFQGKFTIKNDKIINERSSLIWGRQIPLEEFINKIKKILEQK